MQPSLPHITALLSRTPAALNALLRDLPDTWTRRDEGENTMTVFDVVGHLVHGERTNWIPRAKMIIECGETQPFASFGRWGYGRDNQSNPLGQLLDEFSGAREESLGKLRSFNLQDTDLHRRGLHPALGVVTLGQLLSTWAAHDLTHIHQISRIMAHQYRDTVGPFGRFLGVMHCAGHSSS